MTTYPSGLNDTHAQQNVVLVLVAEDTGDNDGTNPCYHYQYKTATSGRSYPSFIFQQKRCLNNEGKMDSNATDSGIRGWNVAPRRTWCNNQYKDAFPSTLLPAIKQVNVKSWNYNNVEQTSEDYFFLSTEKEMQGSTTYAVPTEASVLTQWSYYTISSNRIKQANGIDTTWWLRSPLSSNSACFCSVYLDGIAYANTSYDDHGIAVCGCI